MLGRTHISFGLGLGAGGIVCFNAMTNTPLNGTDLGILYGAVALGSLLPDIDEPNSLLGEKTLGVSNLIQSIFGHRGFTHSLCFVVLLGILLLLLGALDKNLWNEIPFVAEFAKAFGGIIQAQNIEIFGIGLYLAASFISLAI